MSRESVLYHRVHAVTGADKQLWCFGQRVRRRPGGGLCGLAAGWCDLGAFGAAWACAPEPRRHTTQHMRQDGLAHAVGLMMMMTMIVTSAAMLELAGGIHCRGWVSNRFA